MSESAGKNRIDGHLADSSPDRLGDLMGSDSSLPATMDSAGADRIAVASGFVAPRVPGYRVIALLGRGAMGTVWQAHDLTLERDVAIKLLHLPSGEEDAASTRVLREARAAGRLDHPNAVALHHVSRDGDQINIVMELLAGGSLADLVGRKGPMPWRDATIALREAAEGLGAAHAAGLVHRDVKPSNLLRSMSGRVKVADFGVARAGGSQTQFTTPGTIIGTPAYMAPEQCRGEEAGLQCDLYGLGCTYYHLLTGKPPFAGDATSVMYQHCHEPFPDASRLVEEVPRGVIAVIEKLTRKSPADRYASTTELIADLDRVVAPERMGARAVVSISRPFTPGSVNADPGPRDPAWRKRVILNVAILLSLAGCGIVASAVWRWAHRPAADVILPKPIAVAPLPSFMKPILTLLGNIYASEFLGFSADGRYVWSSGYGPMALFDVESKRWKISDGSPAGATLHTSSVVSPTGNLVVQGQTDSGWVQRFDAAKPMCQWPGWMICSLAISPDERLVADAETLADGKSDTVVRTLPNGAEWFRLHQTRCPATADFSPDSRFLVIEDWYGTNVRVWDTAARRELWLETFKNAGNSHHIFSANSSRFLRWIWKDGDSDMNTARVYQTATGRILAFIQAGNNVVAGTISPDGRFVLFAVADHHQALRMWDVDHDQEAVGFAPATAPVSAICVSPDNRRALVGCEDGTLHLLALPDGSELCHLAGHTGRITAVAFSADGRMAVSGSNDKTVRLWGYP